MAMMNAGMTPVCSYNDDKMTDYMDPIWKFNAGQMVMDNMDFGTIEDYYGHHQWYTTM